MDLGCYLLVDCLFLVFWNNIFIDCQWIFLIIFIFSWFVNYYAFFVCLTFYSRVILFLNLIVGILWYDYGFLLVLLIFYNLFYFIFFFQCLMDINFFFQQYLVLNPLNVFVFRCIISCFVYDVFIVISISYFVSRYPIKVRVPINNFWWFL